MRGYSQTIFRTMASQHFNPNVFNINNLSTDPNFDFFNSINSTSYENTSFFSDHNLNPYSDLAIECSYSSIPNCPALNKNDFLIFTFNIQSINAKFAELKDLLHELGTHDIIPDVICLQELWQFPNEALFKINGYKFFYKLRKSKSQGGGVGIYIREDLDCIVHEGLSIFHDHILETIFIELNVNNSKYIVGSIYRPPNHRNLSLTEHFANFSELFSNLLSDLSSLDTPSFIYGDLNIDVLKYSNCPRATEYIDLLFSYGFLQLIAKPTRCTNSSATLIDHCLTNANNLTSNSVILTTNVSDHFPILHYITGPQKRIPVKYVTFRDFSVENMNKFKTTLAGLTWDSVYSSNDTQSSYDNFADIFLTLYNLHFPLVQKKFNTKFHKIDPWFTAGLLVSRRVKINLDKIAAASRSNSDIIKYKKYRNLYNLLVRKAKQLYFNKQLLQNQSNMKKPGNFCDVLLIEKIKIIQTQSLVFFPIIHFFLIQPLLQINLTNFFQPPQP